MAEEARPIEEGESDAHAAVPPITITPSSAAQEAPFVGPALTVIPEDDAAPASPGDGDVTNAAAVNNASGANNNGDNASANAVAPEQPPPSTSGRRRRIRLNIPSGSGARINIRPIRQGNLPQRSGWDYATVPGANNGTHTGGGGGQPNNNNNNHPQHQQQQPTVIMTGGSINMPMMPPLEPQPLPNQSNDDTIGNTVVAGGSDESNTIPTTPKDMKRFECAICYEYMDCPVGCGSCDTRFCHSCLQRVLRQAINHRNPQSTDPPNSAKCPHCRAFFTVESMVIDHTLRKEIGECTETVTCPFQGCGTELPPGLLKEHEATCPYMRLRCRYADWGCNWVGTKKDLWDHDTNQCEFRFGLGKLVERFRQENARSSHLLQQHHMQIAAQSQMLNLSSRQMMMMRGRNAGCVWDVMRLGYETCLFPGRFSATREMWAGLINSLEGRCAVCNVMLLVPSLVLIFHVAFRGFKLLYTLQPDTLSEDDAWLIFDALLFAVIVAFLGILGISCFFIDTKGSTEWTIYNIRHIVPGRPILRDLAAVIMAMAHFCVIEYLGLHPGLMLWKFTTVVTVLYASFVSRIVEKNEPSVSNVRMLRSSRAWSVVIFGLRYGMLTAMCGCAPSVNAVVTLRLLKQYAKVSSKITVEDSECFLSELDDPGLLIVTAGISSALEYSMYISEGMPWVNVLLDWVFATCVLVYVNTFVFLMDESGRRFGETNFHAGTRIFMQAHRASGAVLPNIKPAPIGCAVFGICSFLLLCIAAGW